MKQKLTLTTDRKSAKEGEFIEIRWLCDCCPDSLSLTIDSGYKRDTIAVADSGVTRIAVGRSKGKTTLILKGVVAGKEESTEVAIRVRNISGRKPRGGFKAWKEKMYAGWCVFRAQGKYWWMSRKKWQKALWIAILVLWTGLLIYSFSI